MLKGISPLIAVVLLIAFTVAIGGIISVWLTGFTRTSVGTVGEQAETQIICSYGGINLRSLEFNSSTSCLTGSTENTGTIPLGSIKIQVIYQNASTYTYPLCLVGGTAKNCSVSNLTIKVGESSSFNISVSSNYDKIRVITNCSNVYDEASRSDVST